MRLSSARRRNGAASRLVVRVPWLQSNGGVTERLDGQTNSSARIHRSRLVAAQSGGRSAEGPDELEEELLLAEELEDEDDEGDEEATAGEADDAADDEAAAAAAAATACACAAAAASAVRTLRDS